MSMPQVAVPVITSQATAASPAATTGIAVNAVPLPTNAATASQPASSPVVTKRTSGSCVGPQSVLASSYQVTMTTFSRHQIRL